MDWSLFAVVTAGRLREQAHLHRAEPALGGPCR